MSRKTNNRSNSKPNNSNKSNNKKKVGKSSRNRSAQKVLDAYQIAERQERRNNNIKDSDDEDGGNYQSGLAFEEGILDARKFLKDGQENEDLLDEELDSDEALGSDDDYDVLNSKFSQTLRDKAKREKLNQYSDSEDEEEDDGYNSIDESQLVSLSEAWDMDDRDLASLTNKREPTDIVLNDEWVSESSSSGEEDYDEDEDDDAIEEDGADSTKNGASDDDEEDEEDEDSSSDEEDVFANNEDDDDIDLSKTTKMLKKELDSSRPKERKKFIVENREENEFNVPTKGETLSLAEMMSGVEGVDNILIDKNAKAIATPLPKRIQERNDRGAAYDIAKKEVSKWTDTVQQNRQAEVLKFPMQKSDQINDSANTFRPDNKEPTNEMEKKVNEILIKSNLDSNKNESTFEEIAMAKLSSEELSKRTNELRLMRELMFRDERKAKRLKKIKSKTYHKIKKRERLRNQELVDEAEENEDEEDYDYNRAQERMSQKHKTQSKWAQSMIKSGLSKDASNRSELEEMLRQGERLREKQIGLKDEDQYSDDDLEQIEYDINNTDKKDKIDRSKIGKGVMAMDFMVNAERRKKEENLKELERLKRIENGEDDGLDLFDQDNDNGLVNVTKNTGRRVYNPSAQDTSNINEEILKQVEEDNVSSISKKLNKNQITENSKNSDTSKATIEKLEVDESNPWLSSGPINDPKQKSSKITTIDQDSSKFAKAAAKIAKQKLKKHNSKDDTLIDINETLNIRDIHNDSENEEDAEDSVPKMFKQKDLIKEAFIGDDVVNEFIQEKRKMVEDEDDKEEDLTLPGWGDWAGGSTKPKKRKIIKKIDGIMQKDKRKDKNLKNVIINEKQNKKNLKYQSSDIPFGFETKEQYERSLRMPVGQEWTSRETHQKLTMPRIITKQGVVIDPLKAPFK
ncbi:uncharacterized protein KGF55_005452 [Candida pseudojiufengensis]|uniref:uncharacterized protein n=1 Tax=Candida pseudojiufengensis TaxID=497109 RepID=UPI0022248E81|nr:uncharacterized protein KGF55_005452 [Candida pseudojiufengensis]KAI5959302.1 hypothetical protein KGF55_005452 [Candida pseudojiufengensis]